MVRVELSESFVKARWNLDPPFPVHIHPFVGSRGVLMEPQKRTIACHKGSDLFISAHALA